MSVDPWPLSHYRIQTERTFVLTSSYHQKFFFIFETLGSTTVAYMCH